jgi:hypothetical protein
MRWLLAATLVCACGGEASDEPALARCEFRLVDDGTLFICSETELEHDDPESCNDEVAARFQAAEVDLSHHDGACASAEKVRGCRFAEFHNTIWGYGPEGGEYAEAMCRLVDGGTVVEP